MAYKICSYCIMDNDGDDTIIFDNKGQCDYCRRALEWKDKLYFPNKEGQSKLRDIIARIKKDGTDKPYDCVIGISGGLDSSYLAYMAAECWGLHLLAVHIDDGFDEDLATDNIRRICEKCKIDLKIVKPDHDQFCALTRAYIMAGVPNLAVPQDNVLFATLYGYARDSGIKHVLSGSNFALESIIQRGNTYTAFDIRNIKDINRKNGNADIGKLQFISSQTLRRYLNGRDSLSVVAPLNYIEYNKKNAIKELNDFCGYTYYKSKHLENKLTKFLQIYYLYKKFGVDKRKSHFSSLIVSDQMTRDVALAQMQLPIYDEQDMQATIDEVMHELKISKDEFISVMNQPSHQHTEYKTSLYSRVFKILQKGVRQIRRMKSNAKR